MKPQLKPVALVTAVTAGVRTPWAPFKVDVESSKGIADSFHRLVAESLDRSAYGLTRRPGSSIAGYFEPQCSFIVSPEMERVHSAYFMDDSLLRKPGAKVIWDRVLRTIHPAGGHSAYTTGRFSKATELRSVLSSDVLCLAVARIRVIPTAASVTEGIATSVLLLGHATWEQSNSIMSLYLVDCRNGNVLWADGIASNSNDVEGFMAAARSLVARMP